ncbi:glycosyltransferase N-terminal domain-containing protein [Agriterribacter sp.]|mgnify:CR=1 FL=1|uniref:3-deoxy-D-manno-octulosonic acid transferase n=1 Tax=Agriterribacter sp. TaxID=2821509 RepID=UPI002B808C08|nr:glycosyltransferase N-terminal domain-containing protein [Agriterribacter sp.]HRO45114.1 glycosyltransferase N-terminal domain-containing protein [Agriterribacter sp.]HRQ15445.1 glycosyltransferase N-terminal domain-containing protein [Agriterribacter sp.]
MVTTFYNLFIALYGFAMKLASQWNPKAKQWVNGRKGLFEKLQQTLENLPHDNRPVIWMHCASLGEFEQGRPVLEKIKLLHPQSKVIVTFFSPSGYEIRKNYKGADAVWYLPFDTPSNARKFVQYINPTLVLWVRYEFWLHYLEELKRKEIPLLLLSGTVLKSSPFYRVYRRKLFSCFTHLFVQTQLSAQYLKTEGFEQNVTVAGDTRFDRVIEIAQAFEPIAKVEAFCGGHRVLVAGSTWTEDEEELIHYVKVNPDIRFIIAPHEVDEENIKDLQKEFPHSVLFSALQANSFNDDIIDESTVINTLIIDNIGMLSRLYQYADITYVGGGFGDSGLHNILEAAVYGKPVFFGPVYQRHFEAVEMEEAGGAISIENALELENELNKLWNDETLLKERGDAAKQYVYANAGATGHILDYIYRNLLLTN